MSGYETKTVQEYVLHLSNGDDITVEDEYYEENEYFLPEKIAKAKDHETFWFGDYVKGFIVVPRRSIVYITMGARREVPVSGDPFGNNPETEEEAVSVNA